MQGREERMGRELSGGKGRMKVENEKGSRVILLKCPSLSLSFLFQADQ